MAAIEVTFRPNRVEIEKMFESRVGDTARYLLQIGARVESAAKINATGREYGDGTRGPRVRTGRLRTSIAHSLGVDSRGLLVDVGTNVEYGRYLELGTDRMRPYPFLKPALQAI